MKSAHPDQTRLRKTSLATAISGILAIGAADSAMAQANNVLEEVVVTGIRRSLSRAMDIKRDASGVVDSISAEDLGKFPDLNVAESLQRVTGVSIDRNGGEGQAITVRGLGPQFNTVLLNGRQIATDSGGREFNFDVLSADMISGANVYKSARANLQEGGIGATVNVTTHRPFDLPGLRFFASAKAMYENLSEQTRPSGAFLISNTFFDDRFGVLLSASRQQREVQINRIETAGWRPGQTISNRNDGVLFSNAFIPRNWDQVVDQQKRTRDNANLVLQFAPNDDLSITLDGYRSRFEVDSLVASLASWFEPDRVGRASIDPQTRTLLNFTQGIGLHQGSGDPATDFVSHTRNSRDADNRGLGLNVEYTISDRWSVRVDLSNTEAENDRAGRDRFNVVGMINNYQFDGSGTPTVTHDGFGGGALPDPSRARLHYNDKGNVFSQEDEIDEYKADVAFMPDTGVLQGMTFGAYYQERKKRSFQIFASQCRFCGYGTPAPNEAINLRPLRANNYFDGLIDTFYTYDGDAYLRFLAERGAPIEPTLQNNRYEIAEAITSAYVDFTLGYDIGDMPLTVNIGARYAETDIDVSAVQSFIADVVPTSDLTLFSNVLGPATNISGGGSYSNLLPGVDVKLDVSDTMVLRFSLYDSLTRPTMSELSPATVFNEPRRQNLTASGGNPTLKPFESQNWDLSFEWYYAENSMVSAAAFNKKIDNFITRLTGAETFVMTNRRAADGFRCSTANSALCAPGALQDPGNPGVDVVASTEELNGRSEIYRVSRPRNGESAKVDGYEIAITHVFDNGFGLIANATWVDSNVSLGADTSRTFALEGLGDSQNLIVFFERDKWQVRLAYNNREQFLRLIDNGFNGEPVNTNEYGQWDISGSYAINEHFTVFFEGINISEEELTQTGRFADQIYNIEDNGARYAIGIRGNF